MLNTKIYESTGEYNLIVTDDTGENTFEYSFSKEIPEGQTLQEYLQNCKREAELLAKDAIARKQPPQEIVI